MIRRVVTGKVTVNVVSSFHCLEGRYTSLHPGVMDDGGQESTTREFTPLLYPTPVTRR